MKTVGELLAAGSGHKDWIPLLDTAAKEVFELMLSSQLTTMGTVEKVNMDVTAMVGLAGQLCGVLSVRCTEKSAALMTSKMLGVAVDKVGPEVADALGEVCNMVAGNFKNKIAGLAEGCMLSPPQSSLAATITCTPWQTLQRLRSQCSLRICPSASPSKSTPKATPLSNRRQSISAALQCLIVEHFPQFTRLSLSYAGAEHRRYQGIYFLYRFVHLESELHQIHPFQALVFLQKDGPCWISKQIRFLALIVSVTQVAHAAEQVA
jgi:chemotaxis protein CheX